MTKNHFIVMLCVAALCACTTKGVQFTPEQATLYAGDSIQVSVKNAGATPKLMSENPFVAMVGETSGWIKARHIGETNVYCDYDANSTAVDRARCKVTVQPRYTYYTEPITDWTTTKEQLIAKLGKPTVSQGEMLLYGDVLKDDCIYMYYLNEDHLVQSYVAHKTLTKKEVEDFLLERYSLEPEEGVVYMNSDDEDTATTFVAVEEGELPQFGHLVLVVYTMADDEEDTEVSVASRIEGMMK